MGNNTDKKEISFIEVEEVLKKNKLTVKKLRLILGINLKMANL